MENEENPLITKFNLIEEEKCLLQTEINQMIVDFREKHDVRLLMNHDEYIDDEPYLKLTMLVEINRHKSEL